MMTSSLLSRSLGSLVVLVFAHHYACQPTPGRAPLPPTGPAASSVTSEVAAPVSAAGSIPSSAASAPPTGSAPSISRDPIHAADPGPGWVGCSSQKCEVGRQVCRLDVDQDGGGRRHHCVHGSELKIEPYAVHNCDTSFDYKACDGPGDCPSGQTCCYQKLRLIGACFTDPDEMLERYECKPLRAGQISCHNDEICSASDSTCVRAGSSCVVHKTTGLGSCDVPRRRVPNCDAARCEQGSVCIRRLAPTNRANVRRAGKRECVADGSFDPDQVILIECERGSDCAPDEACFSSIDGERCDFHAVSWVGDDIAVCIDASDCVGFCWGTGETGVCHDDGHRKLCECRPPCTRDSDCRKNSSFCASLVSKRTAGVYLTTNMVSFCDKDQQVCDCRGPP
jgi:hypothetical protein